MDQGPSLDEETIKINRTAFIETMSRSLQHLRTRKLDAREFMDGMAACFEITKTDFRFAYDYLVENLIALAPLMTRTKFLETAQTIYRMASYMHRFETVNAKLPTLYSIAEQQLDKCRPDVKEEDPNHTTA